MDNLLGQLVQHPFPALALAHPIQDGLQARDAPIVTRRDALKHDHLLGVEPTDHHALLLGRRVELVKVGHDRARVRVEEELRDVLLDVGDNGGADGWADGGAD